LEQRRKANRKYEANLAAKLDHAERQRTYCQRQKLKLKKVTGQGSEAATSSVTIDSALISIGFVTKKKAGATGTTGASCGTFSGMSASKLRPSFLHCLRPIGAVDRSVAKITVRCNQCWRRFKTLWLQHAGFLILG